MPSTYTSANILADDYANGYSQVLKIKVVNSRL